MKLFRSIALLIVVCMLMSLTVGFAEPTKSTEMSEPVRFSYMRPVWGPPTYQPGNDFEQALFAAGNVVIDPNFIAVADYDAKVPVLMAGGTDIDVIWNMGSNNAVMRDIISQGAFLALDDLLEKYPAVKDAVYPSTWDLLTSEDGKHYFFPAPLSVFVPFAIYYRTDVFEELGIAVPKSIDELTDCLRAIKAAKPDMIPLTTNELFSFWYFQNVGAAFGYNWGWMVDPNDPERIVPSNTQECFRDYLLWMNMLRKEGLIDPDHMIAAGKLGADTFKAGNAAVIVINWNSYSNLLVELRKNLPDAGIGLITSITGPGGKSGAKNLTGYDRGFSINIKSADKADDIFKYLNWLYTDGYMINRYGFEGKTYNLDEKGNVAEIPDEIREAGYKFTNIEALSFPRKSSDAAPNWLEFYSTFIGKGLTVEDLEVQRMGYEDSVKNYIADLGKEAYSSTAASIGEMLYNDYLKPAIEKMMIDPDADIAIFDEAVQLWLDNGGSAIIDEINAATPDKSAPVYTYDYTGPDYR